MRTTFLERIRTSRRMQAGLIIGLAILLTLLMLRFAFGDSSNGLLLTAGLVALLFAPPTCLLLALHWRKTFYLIIATLVFEGMVRNLSNQVAALLFKDFLLGLVYLGYLYEYKWKFTHLKVFRYFNAAYAALLVYSLIELLNPSLPDITVGLIGLKTLLYYIPLIFIAYEVVDNPQKIKVFAVYIFGLTFISCLFGLYQYVGGRAVLEIFQPVQILEAYGSNGETVGFKLPGTFASASNFSGFLFLSFSVGIGFLYSRTSRSLTLLSLFTVIITSIMFVINSQRAGLVYVALCFLLGTFAYSTSYWFRILRITLASVLLVAFLFAISTDDNAIGTRFAEFTTGNGLQGYLVDNPLEQIEPQLENVKNGRLFGFGIGSAAPGARYILGNAYVFVESFIALLLFELGPIGLLLMSWIIAIIISLSWQTYQQVKYDPLRNFAFFGLVWILYNVGSSITYSPLTVPPAGLFFWIVPGIILRMQEKPKEAPTPAPVPPPLLRRSK